MYKSDLVHVDCDSRDVEDIWQAAKKLSIDEKAELVEKLLGNESELIVVSAHSHLVDYIIAQMSLLSAEGLVCIARAIASRLAPKENSSKS